MNLSKEFHTARDYVRYYKSKFVSIVLPFVLAVCLLSPIDMYQTGIPVTFGSWLDYVYRTLWGFHTNENHLWFMYCMIGMLISAPFLSKLLHAMSDAEIRILLIVAVIWGNAKLYLVNILGRGVLFSCYDYILVEGYLLYFVLGYAVKRNVFPCRGVVLAVFTVYAVSLGLSVILEFLAVRPLQFLARKLLRQ